MGSQTYLQSFSHTDWRLKPELAGGGALTDLGSHYVDLLRWLMPGEARSVTAFQALLTEMAIMPQLEDNAAMLMQFDSGAIAIVDASWSVRVPYRWEEGTEIYGSEGKIMTRGIGSMQGPMHPIEIFTSRQVLGSSTGVILPEYTYDPLISTKREVAHFVNCILEDKEPRIKGEDARKTIECILAGYESAKTGKTIHLSQ